MVSEQRKDAFFLPDLGEGLSEAEVVAWHVTQGDHVVADQPLITVETDKAVVDIPAPHAARIGQLHAEVGSRVQVGSLLVSFGSSDAEPTGASVVGELPVAAARRNKASPKARQRARELGVALGDVQATGPSQTIQVSDVELAARTGSVRPLSGVRRAMAARMADAASRVARASVTGEADISEWAVAGSPMLRLIRAVGAACRAKPILNAGFDDATLTLVEHAEVNLGVAMETANGLFVPVLKDINAGDGARLQAEFQRLEEAVARRTVTPGELRGQTITLSNFGAVGGLHAEMVVVPPQVAIVGAGRAFERAGLRAEQSVRRVLPISVSFDHRAVTGVEACEFLLALTTDLELAR